MQPQTLNHEAIAHLFAAPLDELSDAEIPAALSIKYAALKVALEELEKLDQLAAKIPADPPRRRGRKPTKDKATGDRAPNALQLESIRSHYFRLLRQTIHQCQQGPNALPDTDIGSDFDSLIAAANALLNPYRTSPQGTYHLDFEQLGHIVRDALLPPEPPFFFAEDVTAIATAAVMVSATRAVVPDSPWEDANGLARFVHTSPKDAYNRIEHYITGPGDIQVLPWNEAKQIIDKFGFETAKLQFIFAAYATQLERPWEGRFTLRGTDVINLLGWERRTDLTLPEKFQHIAQHASLLDSLLVRGTWQEGQPQGHKVKVSVDISRLWNIKLDFDGQRNLLSGDFERMTQLDLTVQPGLWTQDFLNRAGSQARQALYQFGFLAQSILKIDGYHNELALRLALHLTLENRHLRDRLYRVKSLLKNPFILPGSLLKQAEDNPKTAYTLKSRWDNALLLLEDLGWVIRYGDNYLRNLRPKSRMRKGPNYFQQFLEATLRIAPPDPMPSAIASPESLSSAKGRALAPEEITPLPSYMPPPIRLGDRCVRGISGEDVVQKRKALGWNQRELAERMGVSHGLICHWERGRRSISDEYAAQLREVLGLD